jgi:hypothetical protein
MTPSRVLVFAKALGRAFDIDMEWNRSQTLLKVGVDSSERLRLTERPKGVHQERCGTRSRCPPASSAASRF